MVRKTGLLTFFLLLFFAFTSQAQLRKIPQEVVDSFAHQYNTADSVEYVDNLVQVHVKFVEDGTRMMATYTNKGKWKETEKAWDFEQLPDAVKDGFSKSKYAGNDWKITNTKIIYRPQGKELYRVKVEKSGLQKMHLFFNESGRMITDEITL